MSITHVQGSVARRGRRPVAVRLETLGLMVNPLSREVLPMRLVLT